MINAISGNGVNIVVSLYLLLKNERNYMAAKRITRIAVLCLTAVFSFALAVFFYNRVQVSNGPLLGSSLDPGAAAVFIAVPTALIVVLLVAFFVLRMAIPEVLAKGAVAVYLLMLLFILFGKSVGVSGLNFDPTNGNLLSAGFILNVLAFVPAGFLLRFALKGTGRTVLVGIVLSVAAEAIQYFCYLGIADILDVAMNTLGFLLGALCVDLLTKHNLKIVDENGKMQLVKTEI